MFEAGSEIAIYNSPVRDLNWFSDNRWGNRLTCLIGEFERIDKYMIQGDLASYKNAIEYQKWKELQ